MGHAGGGSPTVTSAGRPLPGVSGSAILVRMGDTGGQ